MGDQRFTLADLRRYVENEQPTQAKAKSALSRSSKGILIGGNVADAASTIYAVRKGAREGNPVYGDRPNVPKLMAIKGLATLGQVLALSKVAKTHPKVANLTAKAIGAGMGVVAMHNARQGRKAS